MEYVTAKPSAQGKAEIDNFSRNCVNSGLKLEDFIKEATNKMIEHGGRETISTSS